MVVREPQAAGDYDDRTTAAVKSVLIEIGQILGSFQGKFAIIGGAVPWLLLGEAEMPHVGTADVDLGLDPAALGGGEYVRLVEALQEHGYLQRDNLQRFQLVRTVPAGDGEPDIDVVVDFLMPRDAEITRNTPPLISQFAVQRADGAEGHSREGKRDPLPHHRNRRSMRIPRRLLLTVCSRYPNWSPRAAAMRSKNS